MSQPDCIDCVHYIAKENKCYVTRRSIELERSDSGSCGPQGSCFLQQRKVSVLEKILRVTGISLILRLLATALYYIGEALGVNALFRIHIRKKFPKKSKCRQ